MKSFLYKSKLLILIYVTAGFLLTLASAAINNKYMNSQKVLPCLSNGYIVGKVMSVNIDTDQKITNKHLMKQIDSIEEDFIFFRNISNTRGRAIVYSEKSGFSLPIISGRIFQKEDFDCHTNSIIISQELEDNCINIEDKKFYIYNNEYYEVIGIYQGVLGDDIQEAQFYINLYAEKLQDDYAYGEYLFDIKNGQEKQYTQFKNYLSSLDKDATIQQEHGLSGKGIGLWNVVSNAGEMILIFIVSALLVLINSIAVSEHWITARRKEIAIRKLLGATYKSIVLWIIFQYVGLIFISYVIAIVCAGVLIMNSQKVKAIPTLYLLLGDKLQLQTPFISFFMLLAVGFIVLMVVLYQYSRNTIVSNVR